jgi:hypothetical protein
MTKQKNNGTRETPTSITNDILRPPPQRLARPAIRTAQCSHSQPGRLVFRRTRHRVHIALRTRTRTRTLRSRRVRHVFSRKTVFCICPKSTRESLYTS